MSRHQSRVDRSDGQLRKSAGRSGHGRGFSGGGGGGRGGGGGAAYPHQLSTSSSSSQPSLSSNHSLRNSGNNGQGGQSRGNPASLVSETSTATATPRAVQNGAHSQPPSLGSSTTPMPSGPKLGNTPVPRTSWALPKAPPSQSAVVSSDSAAPSTPVNGNGTKPFALQFGTISPGIVNGLQIPVRTSSALPNLDEQKRDQARHHSFRAVPTQPIPPGLKQHTQPAWKDVSGINQSAGGESHPSVQVTREVTQQISTAPAAPQPKSAALPIPGVSRNDRQGIGMMDEDRWSKVPVSFPPCDIRSGQGVNHGGLRNPRGQPSNQFPILPGPVQSLVPQGGPVRNNSDSDRWRNNSRGLMPPPQTPLLVMHKAERKYEIGKVSDQEQAKQRQLKAILNKLTPQKFEKLFPQVKEVNIDNTVTLSGVVAQIFDKALMEPTFCEMYANFCFHLSGELPDFTENDEKITFKRLLLNKCQEEFERGEREQAEADRVEEEGEIKHSEEEREEKRIKAQRRMLGNIRLIGELYKKKMLTERIMHECIQKLLGQYQNPDEEDLEALCKLMSTIGDQIDHPKAKELTDAYFDMMLKLSTNQKLSSRVRFLLRDVIDLRKNRWQQRRKVSDQEQAKQRQLKAILNKLTPQKFEKLFQQVKEVNIDNTVTLSGVVAQIFDKALMEPTFCEMYANFCCHLSGELPDFTENDEKITFKRLLLNKCQEEFERGEREQAEADRVEEEGEIKHSEEEREEKRIKARRRMLGNIRLIGELYKKKMLTERIMHECIQKLLGQYQNPDEEDLEALCKLMSTIGDQIDHPKAKEHIDAYFDMMLKLSTNQKLSSRVRFLLRDVIDLRKNRWQQRRKVLDQEEAKQRQLKAILNKLTPQKFEKLFQQVKEVNIDNTVTLSGVVAQIFDKALMEPTFCEMYANFCFHLSGELPDFTENDEKITSKRLLLNKCQEEFERGEREQAEADRVEEEGEIRHSEEEREEKRIKARRRMLGNIRLIGELYKKKMLTERIMHECIQKLLGQYQNPDEEDLEALCKLMSTIGDQIDHPKAKEHIDAYFDMMLKLSTNQKLSSRVRFLLRDVIDLRKNRWQQRRKVVGPKKIDEVHRDAAQERQSQTSRLTRGPSMGSASRRGLPVDYGHRGSSVLPSPSLQIGGIRGVPTQVRGYGMQDVRSEDHHPLENRTLSFPLTQRCTGV